MITRVLILISTLLVASPACAQFKVLDFSDETTNSPAVSASGRARIYFDGTELLISIDGGAYQNLSGQTGGSGVDVDSNGTPTVSGADTLDFSSDFGVTESPAGTAVITFTGTASFSGDLAGNDLTSSTSDVTIRAASGRSIIVAFEDSVSSTDSTDLEAFVGATGAFHGDDLTHTASGYTFTAKDPVNESSTSGATKGRPYIGMAWGDATAQDFVKIGLRGVPRLQVTEPAFIMDDCLQMTNSSDTAPHVVFPDSGISNGGIACFVFNLADTAVGSCFTTGTDTRTAGVLFVSATVEGNSTSANGVFEIAGGTPGLIQGTNVTDFQGSPGTLNVYREATGLRRLQVENNLGATKNVMCYFIGHWGFNHQE